ncbi:MAG: hypothetical protein IIC12_03405 [Proteobacteria bacterium]|nr:hypothetical protein [Pseudomonadota bacterium]
METLTKEGVKKRVIEGLGGTDIHNNLFGRSTPDAHPIGAITDLQTELDDLDTDIAANAALLVNHETRITNNETDISALDDRVTDLEDDLNLTSRFDDTASGAVLYLGEADPGTAEASATWRIQQITFTNLPTEDDLQVLWADGDNSFDNIWNDRLSLSYS